MLATGSRTAATSAATQTACRCVAGLLRRSRQADAATAAISVVCQKELSKKVSSERLIVSIWFLVGLLQELLNLPEFLGRHAARLYKVQHEAIGRTSKKAVEYVTNRL